MAERLCSTMKKLTKSLWIYSAILFIIAIGLIFTATILQARLISPDGNIEVLGTFTTNAKQNIENLTNENIALTDKLNSETARGDKLQADYDALNSAYKSELEKKDTVKQLYAAYSEKNYEKTEELCAKITKEEADEFIEGLYDNAQKLLKNKR